MFVFSFLQTIEIRSRILSKLNTSPLAFRAARITFVVDMPGISTGFCIVIIIPSLPRSSTFNLVIFFPKKLISPSVICSLGSLIRAEPKVDFPAPFGPKITTVSPCATSRLKFSIIFFDFSPSPANTVIFLTLNILSIITFSNPGPCIPLIYAL